MIPYEPSLSIKASKLIKWLKDVKQLPSYGKSIDSIRGRLQRHQVKDLKILKCTNEQLAQIIDLLEKVGWLEEIRSLDISCNGLSVLPASISKMVNLHALRASYNFLTAIPECIISLRYLFYLQLQNNRLESLPDNIGSMPILDTLYCSNNQLTSLPDSLGSLKLYEAAFFSNPFITIPESLCKFKNNGGIHFRLSKFVRLPNNPEFLSWLDYGNYLGTYANELETAPICAAKLTFQKRESKVFHENGRLKQRVIPMFTKTALDRSKNLFHFAAVLNLSMILIAQIARSPIASRKLDYVAMKIILFHLMQDVNAAKVDINSCIDKFYTQKYGSMRLFDIRPVKDYTPIQLAQDAEVIDNRSIHTINFDEIKLARCYKMFEADSSITLKELTDKFNDQLANLKDEERKYNDGDSDCALVEVRNKIAAVQNAYQTIERAQHSGGHSRITFTTLISSQTLNTW